MGWHAAERCVYYRGSMSSDGDDVSLAGAEMKWLWVRKGEGGTHHRDIQSDGMPAIIIFFTSRVYTNRQLDLTTIQTETLVIVKPYPPSHAHKRGPRSPS